MQLGNNALLQVVEDDDRYRANRFSRTSRFHAAVWRLMNDRGSIGA